MVGTEYISLRDLTTIKYSNLAVCKVMDGICGTLWSPQIFCISVISSFVLVILHKIRVLPGASQAWKLILVNDIVK